MHKRLMAFLKMTSELKNLVVVTAFFFFCNLLSIFIFYHYTYKSPNLANELPHFFAPDSISTYLKSLKDAKSFDFAVQLKNWRDSRISIQQNIMTLVYRNFPASPYMLFTFNAAVHALCGALVFLILKTVSSFWPSFAGSLIFVSNPSSLEWTANMLKDGIFIFALLLFLFCILK